jgi:hypothetical protein
MKINGLKVIDADSKVKLNITPRDIGAGTRKSPATCPAAQAACRLPNVLEARVHITRTYIKKRHGTGGVWIRYKTPPSLHAEIVAVDRGGTFEPGIYTLSPMPRSGRLGVYKVTGKKVAKGKKRKVYHASARHVTTNVRPRGANR